jgi:hypothetical protein
MVLAKNSCDRATEMKVPYGPVGHVIFLLTRLQEMFPFPQVVDIMLFEHFLVCRHGQVCDLFNRSSGHRRWGSFRA